LAQALDRAVGRPVRTGAPACAQRSPA